MPGDRSNASILAIGSGRDGFSNLTVFRPVPAPSSVMAIGWGMVLELADKRENTLLRREGSKASSSACRMLPSVSYTLAQRL